MTGVKLEIEEGLENDVNKTGDQAEGDSKRRGVIFVYALDGILPNKPKNATANPHITIKGLTARDLSHQVIFNLLTESQHYSFTATPIKSKTAASKNDSDKKAAAKDDEADGKAEGDEAKANGDEAEAKADDADETPDNSVKNTTLSILFAQDGDTVLQAYTTLLTKWKRHVEGRDILVAARLRTSSAEHKQELERMLKEYGAEERPSSLYRRMVCFKRVPADLTEETIRIYLPDIEDFAMRDDDKKVKCCVVTLPTPDRAETVVTEKNKTKTLGSNETVDAFLMSGLNFQTLAMSSLVKQKQKWEAQRKSYSSTSDRGGKRGASRRWDNDYGSDYRSSGGYGYGGSGPKRGAYMSRGGGAQGSGMMTPIGMMGHGRRGGGMGYGVDPSYGYGSGYGGMEDPSMIGIVSYDGAGGMGRRGYDAYGSW